MTEKSLKIDGFFKKMEKVGKVDGDEVMEDVQRTENIDLTEHTGASAEKSSPKRIEEIFSSDEEDAAKENMASKTIDENKPEVELDKAFTAEVAKPAEVVASTEPEKVSKLSSFKFQAPLRRK